MDSFGSRLRELRQAKNWSLRRLAAATHVNYTYLWEIETGRKPGTIEIARLCDTTLGCGTQLTDLASRQGDNPVSAIAALGRADVDRRSFLRSAAYSAALSAIPLTAGVEPATRLTAARPGQTSGIAEADAIRRVTDAFTAIDETRGGTIGRTAVAEFLATDVTQVLDGSFSSDQARTDAYSAAAEVAYLCGWKAHDCGLDGLAQRYYLAALKLAEHSGQPGHDAYVVRILALQGNDVGHGQYSPALAEEALRRARGQVDADTEALFRLAVARCHAATGNRRAALAALRAAEPNLNPDTSREVPRWLEVWCPNKATLLTQAGQTFKALGETVEAERYYRAAAALWNPATHARIYALAMATAGHMQWRNGDTSTAENTWRTATPILRSIESARTREALAKIRAKTHTSTDA